MTVHQQIRAELTRQIELTSVGSSKDLDLAELPYALLTELLDQKSRQPKACSQFEWIEMLLESGRRGVKLDIPAKKIVSLYQTILKIDPNHREAVFALGVLYFDLRQPKALIDLYRERIAQAESVGEKISLHLYIAEALSSQLSDHETAFQEVVTASRLDPRNLRIIDQLERLGRKANRDHEVTVILGEMLLHATDPHIRAGLALRLAELCLSSFDQPERALAYYRSALFDDGGDPNNLKEIKDVFRQTHRFVELGRQLEEMSRDRRTSPPRNRMQQELIHIYRDTETSQVRSLETLLQSVKQNPDDRQLLDEMASIAKTKEEYEILALALMEVIARGRNPLLVHFSERRLGQLYLSKLRDPEKAIGVYEELLEKHPYHLEVLHALGQLYFKHRKPLKTLHLYREILKLEPEDYRARKACAELSLQVEDVGIDPSVSFEREKSQ